MKNFLVWKNKYSNKATKFTNKIWLNSYKKKNFTTLWKKEHFKWREKCQKRNLYTLSYINNDLSVLSCRIEIPFQKKDLILKTANFCWMTSDPKKNKFLNTYHFYNNELKKEKENGFDFIIFSSQENITAPYWERFFKRIPFQCQLLSPYKSLIFIFPEIKEFRYRKSFDLNISELHSSFEFEDIKKLIKSEYMSGYWNLAYSQERWKNELRPSKISGTSIGKIRNEIACLANYYYYDYNINEELKKGAFLRFLFVNKLSIKHKIEFIQYLLDKFMREGNDIVNISTFSLTDEYALEKSGFLLTNENYRIYAINLSERFNANDIKMGLLDLF
ncbi:MAG: hypothetical protein ACOC56_01350 [Atribacterota bacterium]